MTIYYTCKHCGHEIEVHVTINEEDDLAESCPECNAPIPDRAHEDVQTAAIDQAHDTADRWYERE